MSHEVFISYSHVDKPVADGICANLEAAGLRCWIAPRDIGPGEDWPTAIATGIAGSKMMVLVFSQSSNISEEVSRELYLAASSKVIIIPFVIENVKPEAGKAYYLGRTHWLDAMNPPTNEQIGQLIERVNALLQSEGSTAGAQSPELREHVRHRKVWALPAVLLLIAALAVGGIFLVPQIREAFFPVGLSPVSSIDPSFYLLREDFNDPQFDGSLPAEWAVAQDWCSNVKILQENGSLTIDAPAGIRPQCNLGPGTQFPLGQIKAVEYSLSVSPQTPANHPSFAFMLAGQEEANTSIYLICGLMGNGSGCNVKQDQRDVYRTKSFQDKPGVAYIFRTEVLDAEQMSFRFIVNGETIGEFTVLPADVPIYKDLPFRVNGGLVHSNDQTKAGLYLMDYLAVEQR